MKINFGWLLLAGIVAIGLGCLIFAPWLGASPTVFQVLSILKPIYMGCVFIGLVILGIGAYLDYRS